MNQLVSIYVLGLVYTLFLRLFQNLMDCVSLCDVVLNSVDSILQTVTLSDSDLVGSYKEDSVGYYTIKQCASN